MKKLLLSWLVLLSVNLFAADSPVGTWEVSTKGEDQGYYRFTFGPDNSFTGYGINRSGDGVDEFSGTWAVSADDKFIVVTLPPEDEGDSTTTVQLKVKAGSKISGIVNHEEGSFPLIGRPIGGIPFSMVGNWAVVAKQGREVSNVTLTFEMVEQFPGVFMFMDGDGITGVVYVAADGQLRGVDTSEGNSTPMVGKVNFRKNTFNVNLFNDDGVTKAKGARQ